MLNVCVNSMRVPERKGDKVICFQLTVKMHSHKHNQERRDLTWQNKLVFSSWKYLDHVPQQKQTDEKKCVQIGLLR